MLLRFIFIFACALAQGQAAPFINEFHAENVGPVLNSLGATTGVNDVNGNGADWIELRNPDAASVNLNGWALSDDPALPGKWVFPNVSIAAGGHLLVFASGKDRAVASVQLHTNFKLGSTGAVVLSQPDGAGGWTVRHQIGTVAIPYPAQKPRCSFGYPGTSGPGGAPGYFETQTPGAANNALTVSAFVQDTSFSVNRGFYTTVQSVTITTLTPGATLIYTTNQSEPTSTNGTQVAPPDAVTRPSVTLNIATTTVLRARAIKTGLGATNVDTHTYIFPAAVLQQSAATVTQPFTGWGHDKGDANTAQSDLADADWEMDPNVVNHANPEDKVIPGDLLAIPTVSVVLNWAELFGASGIYIAGEGVDKQASFELLNPDGDPVNPNVGSDKQQAGKVHVFGGSSTQRWKSDKLSMGFSFWADLSTGVLGDSAIGSYDSLVLDARLNQVWNHSQDATQRNRGDFVRDAIMSDLQNNVGSYGPHSQHVHLYLNGLYWGIYTLHEKPEEHFAEAYLGGDSDDYDVVKHAPSHPGYLVAGRVLNPALPVSNTNHSAGVNYQTLLTLANADLTVQANYDALAAKLDIADLIKYMLINFYGGNTDWAHQNWYATFNRVRPDGRWRFHSWDAEHVFKDLNDNATTRDDLEGPTHLHQRLALNPEYRRLFGDAAHLLLFNAGDFTPARAKALFDTRLMDINEAIRAESARWGDNGPSTATSPSPERHLRFSNVTTGGTFISWWNERLRILNTILDGTSNRTTVLLSQLRSRTLYPTFDAPLFSQHGGLVPANYSLSMTNPGGAGTIYYTLDGTDPRVPWTGALASAAQTYSGAIVLTNSVTVRARVRNGAAWSALNLAAFSVATTPAAAGNLVISKIHYRPAAPTSAEIAAGHSERSDFEFIEVLNIGATRLFLGGLSFSAGLDIAPISGGVTELAPGGRALYVAKKSAFEFRYGLGLPIAGEFVLGSNLANGGETLTLLAANGAVIVTLDYDNAGPWPLAADGAGPALVLMRPATSDPTLGASWRQSTAANGAPGADDRLLLAPWLAAHFPGGGADAGELADPEGDGLVNRVEFGLGTDPNAPTPPSARPSATPVLLSIGGNPADWFLTFSFRLRKAAEELTWTAETSTDLLIWSSAPADILPLAPFVDHGDGTETRAYRASQPMSAEERRFFRATVARP